MGGGARGVVFWSRCALVVALTLAAVVTLPPWEGTAAPAAGRTPLVWVGTGAGDVYGMDVTDGRILRHLPGSSPVLELGIGPRANRLYVGRWGEFEATVDPVNLDTLEAGEPGVMPVTFESDGSPGYLAGLAVRPNGGRIYAVTGGGGECCGPGYVGYLQAADMQARSQFADGCSLTDIAAVPPNGQQTIISDDCGRYWWTPVVSDEIRLIGRAAAARGVAVTPDGATAWILERGSAGSQLTPVDTRSHRAGRPVVVSSNDDEFMAGFALTPDGQRAVVSLIDVVVLVDLLTGARKRLNVPAGSVAVTPDGRTAVVVRDRMTVIDLSRDAVVARHPLPDRSYAVVVEPDQAPSAAFTATSTGRTVRLDASATTVRYGTVAEYAWDFGDGTTAVTTTPRTSHRYAAPGSYRVTLTCTSSAGTSTIQVFTGHQMLRNGGPQARTSRTVSVG